MTNTGNFRTLQFLLIIVLTGVVLHFLKPVLVPIAFAIIFSLLLLPVSDYLEKKGINRGLSSLISILIFIAVVAGIMWLLISQMQDLVKDLGNIKGKMTEAIEQAKNFISDKFGIEQKEQEKIVENNSKESAGKAALIPLMILSILVDFILMLVYIFLFLFFRSKIREFLFKISSGLKNTKETLNGVSKVSRQYITGMGLMIVCLWIMYSIGFSIVGLQNPFFFAILCGVLEIVPFVGNITGNALAVIMAVTQGGGSSMIIGIVITYFVVQFIQSYILELLIVGPEVNVNPLFTLIALILGEYIWGIAGLILAIPLMGIFKIICDHYQPLKPLGELIGNNKREGPALSDKIKKLFKKKKK